jgi:hypothetical protein
MVRVSGRTENRHSCTTTLPIHLRGVEEDWPDPDDVAESPLNPAQPLISPVGRFKEQFDVRKQSFAAVERESNIGFEFHVNVEFTAIYITPI